MSTLRRILSRAAVVAVAFVGLSACAPADAISQVAGQIGMSTQTVTAGSATYTVYWKGTASVTRGGVMLVHGGGWTGGDRRRFTEEAKKLANQGYVAATIDYRLATSAPSAWPAQTQDALSAWRELRKRAATYKLDVSKLAIAGESAGGHIALAAVEAMVPTERPSAVVSWSGPTDLVRMFTNPQPTCSGSECYYYSSLNGTIQDRLIRCRYAIVTCRPKYVAASPALNVSSKLPPTLQTFFTREVVPDDQGRVMDAALRARAGSSTFKLYPGFGHGGTWTPQVWNDSVTFLKQYMGATDLVTSQQRTAPMQQAVTRVPLKQLLGK